MSRRLASLLLPTRGRPAELVQSLRSVRDTVDDPSRVEVIVWADDDDAATHREIDSIASGKHPGLGSLIKSDPVAWNRDKLPPAGQLQVYPIVGPRGRGYADLHRFYNVMANHAGGSWLILWNDDARMVTPGWDSRLAAVPDDGKPAYLWFTEKRSGRELDWFPGVHRSFVWGLPGGAVGHFSQSAHNDTYLREVFRPFPHRQHHTGIVIDHHLVSDLTFAEASAQFPQTKPEFDSERVQQAIVADRAKIRALLGG
jgi:hypothetical protein